MKHKFSETLIGGSNPTIFLFFSFFFGTYRELSGYHIALCCITYVTTYATLSHLYDGLLTNQSQFKIKESSTNTGVRHGRNWKVSRRLSHTVYRFMIVQWS